MAKVYLRFAAEFGDAGPFAVGAPDILLSTEGTSFVDQVGVALNRLRGGDKFCLVRQLSDSADEFGTSLLNGEVAMLFVTNALFINGNCRLSAGDLLCIPNAAQVPTFEGRWSAFVFCHHREPKVVRPPIQKAIAAATAEVTTATDLQGLATVALAVAEAERKSRKRLNPVEAFHACSNADKRLRMIKALSRTDLVLCVRADPASATYPINVEERIYAVLFGKKLRCGK